MSEHEYIFSHVPHVSRYSRYACMETVCMERGREGRGNSEVRGGEERQKQEMSGQLARAFIYVCFILPFFCPCVCFRLLCFDLFVFPLLFIQTNPVTGINVGNERFCKRQIFYATFHLPMFSVSFFFFFFFFFRSFLIIRLGFGKKKKNTKKKKKKTKKH